MRVMSRTGRITARHSKMGTICKLACRIESMFLRMGAVTRPSGEYRSNEQLCCEYERIPQQRAAVLRVWRLYPNETIRVVL